MNQHVLAVLHDKPFPTIGGDVASHFAVERKLVAQVRRELQSLQEGGLVTVEEIVVGRETVSCFVLTPSGRAQRAKSA